MKYSWKNTQPAPIVKVGDRYVRVASVSSISEPNEHHGGPNGDVCKETYKFWYTIENSPCLNVCVPVEEYHALMESWMLMHGMTHVDDN